MYCRNKIISKNMKLSEYDYVKCREIKCYCCYFAIITPPTSPAMNIATFTPVRFGAFFL